MRRDMTGAEVQMIEVTGDGLIERRQLGIDQEVVMAGIFSIGAGGRDVHVAQSEIERELRRHGCAVLEVDEIDFGSRSRARRPPGSLVLRRRDAAAHSADQRHCRERFHGLAACDIMKRPHDLRPSGACANASKATILTSLVKWASMAYSKATECLRSEKLAELGISMNRQDSRRLRER